jgi:hypothetical protein
VSKDNAVSSVVCSEMLLSYMVFQVYYVSDFILNSDLYPPFSILDTDCLRLFVFGRCLYSDCAASGIDFALSPRIVQQLIMVSMMNRDLNWVPKEMQRMRISKKEVLKNLFSLLICLCILTIRGLVSNVKCTREELSTRL